MISRYAAEALERGERVTYLAHRTDEPQLRAYLDEAGLNATTKLDSGQLRFVDIEGSYLQDGHFDPERQADLLADMAHEARADGFSGLAVVAEMSWALTEPNREPELVAYERMVNRVFADGALHALCQYDRRAFAGETVSLARHCHDVAIETGDDGTTVHRGPFTVRERARAGTFALAGEADFFAAPYLAGRIQEALRDDGDGGDVTIDARELRFADVAACRAIVTAAQSLAGDRRLRVMHAQPGLRRILALCDWLQDPRLEVV